MDRNEANLIEIKELFKIKYLYLLTGMDCVYVRIPNSDAIMFLSCPVRRDYCYKTCAWFNVKKKEETSRDILYVYCRNFFIGVMAMDKEAL